MPDYLVEAYEPRGPKSLPALGAEVRHVHTIHVPDDELCLHVVAGPDREAVRRALELAAVAFDRISDAIAVGPTKGAS